MTREEFLSYREQRLLQDDFGNKFAEEFQKSIKDIIVGIDPEYLKGRTFETEFEIEFNDSGVKKITTKPIDRSTWSYKEVEEKRVSDQVFLNEVNPNLLDIAQKLITHIRELHPDGKLVKGETTKKFTNYRLKKNRIYRNDNFNFVAFIPQEEAIKVFVFKGDYLKFKNIRLDEDGSYLSFKINQSYQIPDAKDAIENSYYIFIHRLEGELP
ncbi:MAG: hypothetical protein R2753_13885 [Chitinophagales bacterium]